MHRAIAQQSFQLFDFEALFDGKRCIVRDDGRKREHDQPAPEIARQSAAQIVDQEPSRHEFSQAFDQKKHPLIAQVMKKHGADRAVVRLDRPVAEDVFPDELDRKAAGVRSSGTRSVRPADVVAGDRIRMRSVFDTCEMDGDTVPLRPPADGERDIAGARSDVEDPKRPPVRHPGRFRRNEPLRTIRTPPRNRFTSPMKRKLCFAGISPNSAASIHSGSVARLPNTPEAPVPHRIVQFIEFSRKIR
jgi:hypothetical protein